MIIEIKSLKELPYKTYTAYLLKSKDDLKPNDSGWLYNSNPEGIKNSNRMIILFTEFIEEIDGINNKSLEMVK